MRKSAKPKQWTTLALLAVTPGFAVAGPQGANVVAGAATINHSSTHGTIINQGSAKAIINWQSFSIGANEFVQFNQPDSNSISLNRVVGSDPSSILGNLSANGQVFLVNPNGIFFGAGATLDVGGLVASTFDINNDDFLNGNYIFTKALNADAKSVVNAGAIQARESGYVVLMGDRVENSGRIETKFGQIALLAGGEVTLDINGDGLVSYSIDSAAATELAGVENAGELIADGGRVILAGKVSDALVATAVNNSGLIQANGIEERNGEIYLTGNADIYNSGTISASGQSGGQIVIQAKRVAQQGRVQADATVGHGGKVSITADEVIALTHASLTTANAGEDGNGGEVIIYTAGSAIFNYGAQVEAKGGRQSGDGGFVEVSGLDRIEINGFVDASATNGAAGTFLIDPTNIKIVSADTSDVDLTDPGMGSTRVFENDGNTNNEILDTTIEMLLDGGTSVTLKTADTGAGDGGDAGDITVDAQIDKTAGGAATLTLQADNDIILNQDIVSTTGALSVVLEADGNVTFNTGVDINSNGGDVTITADNDGSNSSETISMADGTIINVGAGKIALNADGDISVGQLISTDTSNTSIQLNSVNGAILDAGDVGGADVTSAGRLVISSEAGVAGLETDVVSLDVTNDSSGDVIITEANAITINNAVQSTAGNINISTTAGSITVDDGGGASDVITTASNGSIDLNAGGAGSDIILQDRIQSASGAITLVAADVVDFQSNGKLTSSIGDVSVTATAGAIVDNNGNSEDISAATVTLSAATGVGASGNEVETNASSLNLSSTTGGIYIKENDDVTILAASAMTSGDINISANGKITVSDADDMTASTVIQVAASGTVILAATSANNDDIDVRDRIQSASGAITLLANDSITFTDDGDITSTSGLVTITADANGNSNGNDNDAITMSSGTIINAGSGAIDLNSDGNVALGQLTTTGTVNVDATNGDITDANAASNNVTASIATLTSQDGIGALANALETAATTLDLSVTGNGDISIDQTGNVDLAGIDTVGGAITISGSGAITTSAAISADSNVSLTAATSLNTGNITVTNDDISLTAGTTLDFVDLNNADNILLSAGGAVTSTSMNPVTAATSVSLAGTGTGATYNLSTDTAQLNLNGGLNSVTVDNTAFNGMTAGIAFNNSGFGSVVLNTDVNTNVAGSLSATGSINIDSANASLSVANTLSGATGVTLNGSAVSTADLNASAGAVSVTADDGNITLGAVSADSISITNTGISNGNITTAQLDADNGGISVNASGDLVTNNVNALLAAGAIVNLTGNTVTSGNISTNATNGTVNVTGNANSGSNIINSGNIIAGTTLLDADTISAGSITTNSLTVQDGTGLAATDLTLTGALTIPAANIAVSGALNVSNVTASSGNVSLTGDTVAAGDISTNTTTGTVTVTANAASGTNTINIGNVVTNAVSLDGFSISANAISANSLAVKFGLANANDLTLNGNLISGTAVNLTTVNALNVQDVTASTGNVALTSSNSTIDSGNITSTLGSVNVNANGQYTLTGNINAVTGISVLGSGISASSSGNMTTTAGNIGVTAATSNISVGNLTANAVGASIAVEATTGDASVGALNADMVSIIASSLTLNDTYTNGTFTATNTLTVNGTITNSNILLTAKDFLLGNTGLLQDSGVGSTITINASDSIVLDGTVNVALGTFNANITGASGSITGSGTSTANVVNLVAKGNIGTAVGNQLTLNAPTVNLSGTLSNAFVDLSASNAVLNLNSAVTNSIDVDAANLTLGGSTTVSATDINITTSGNLSLGKSLNATNSVSLNVAGVASDDGNSVTTTTLNLAGNGSYGATLSPFNTNATAIDINSTVSSVVLDNAATAITGLNFSGGGTHGTLDISAVSDVNLTAGSAVNVTALSIDTTGALDIATDITVSSPNALNLQANGIDSNSNTLTADTINFTGTTASSLDVVADSAIVNLGAGFGPVTLDTTATAVTNLNFNSANYGDVAISSDGLTINGTNISTGNVAINAGAGNISNNANLNAVAAMGSTTVALDTSGQIINNATITASDMAATSSIIIGGTTPVSAMSGAGQYKADAVTMTAANSATVTAVTNTAALTVNGGANLNIDNTAYAGATTFTYGQTGYTSLDLKFGGATNLVGADITTSGVTSISGLAGLTLNQAYNASVINLTVGGQVNTNGLLTAASINFAGNGSASFGSSSSKVKTNSTLLDIGVGISDVFIDNTVVTGNSTVNISGTNYGVVDIDFGGTSSQVGTVSTSTVQGNDFLASALAVSANGNIDVTAGFDVSGGTVLGVVGDTLLTSSIASVGGLINAGGSSDPNASFIGTDSVTLNIDNLSQSNQYLLVKADDINFTGTSNAANLLVQLTPFSISQTDMLGNTTFSSLSFNQSIVGTADFNYTFAKHFAPFTGTTIALGEQGFNGNIDIGTVNAGSKNILFLSGGTITGINNISGTGLLGSADEVGGFFITRPVITTITVDQLGSFGFKFGARVSSIELNGGFDAAGEGENNKDDLELEEGGVNDGSEKQCS